MQLCRGGKGGYLDTFRNRFVEVVRIESASINQFVEAEQISTVSKNRFPDFTKQAKKQLLPVEAYHVPPTPTNSGALAACATFLPLHLKVDCDQVTDTFILYPS